MGRFKTRKTKKIRGGSTNRLPLSPSITFDRFNTEWNMIHISGHGSSAVKNETSSSLRPEMFIVPANTYIINLATAGKSCLKFVREIEQILYNVDESFNRETIFQQLKNGTFMKEYLYLNNNTNNSKMLYPPNNNNNNTPSRASQSISIYTPGDLLSNTSISFFNHNSPYYLMGGYEIQIPKERLYEIARMMGPGTMSTSLHEHLFNRPDNLLKDLMFDTSQSSVENILRKYKLSELIKYLNNLPINSGKNRLYIVRACRTYSDSNFKKLLRKYSVMSRKLTPSTITFNKELLEYIRTKFKTALQSPLLPFLFNKETIEGMTLSVNTLDKMLDRDEVIPVSDIHKIMNLGIKISLIRDERIIAIIVDAINKTADNAASGATGGAGGGSVPVMPLPTAIHRPSVATPVTSTPKQDVVFGPPLPTNSVETIIENLKIFKTMIQKNPDAQLARNKINKWIDDPSKIPSNYKEIVRNIADDFDIKHPAFFNK